MPQGNPVPQQPVYGQAPVQKQKKPVNVKLIVIISAAVFAVIAVIVAVVVFMNIKKRTINLDKYITIEYDGYETIGTAYASLDETKLLEAVMHAQGKKSVSDVYDLLSVGNSRYYENLYDLFDSIEVEAEPIEGLSNGDTVTVTVTYDSSLMKKNKVRFKKTTKTFTVEGLEEVTEVNPFDDISLTFNGTSPNGYVYYDNSSDIDEVRWATFEFDKDDALANGDTITLTVSDDSIEYAIENGYKFTETSKEYTVEGLEAYVTSTDELTDDVLKLLKADAEEEIEDAYYWYDDDVALSDIKYQGYYLLVNKDLDTYYNINALFTVYTATLTSLDNEFETQTVYLAVELDDILLKSDGSVDHNYSVQIVGDITVPGHYYTLDGCLNAADMYGAIVTYNEDSYDSYTSDELPDYSKADTSTSEDETTGEDETTAEDETAA